MRIKITMDLDDEYVDEDHTSGISEAGYELIVDALMQFGGEIDVDRA